MNNKYIYTHEILPTEDSSYPVDDYYISKLLHVNDTRGNLNIARYRSYNDEIDKHKDGFYDLNGNKLLLTECVLWQYLNIGNYTPQDNQCICYILGFNKQLRRIIISNKTFTNKLDAILNILSNNLHLDYDCKIIPSYRLDFELDFFGVNDKELARYLYLSLCNPDELYILYNKNKLGRDEKRYIKNGKIQVAKVLVQKTFEEFDESKLK